MVSLLLFHNIVQFYLISFLKHTLSDNTDTSSTVQKGFWLFYFCVLYICIDLVCDSTG